VIVDVSSANELDVLQEVLVENIYPIEKICFYPALILDCGSNVGYFAALTRVKYPQSEIVCWEPERGNFARLSAQPLLQNEKVRLYQAAVSDAEGEAYLRGDGAGGSLGERGAGAQPVRRIDFPRWIMENGRYPMLVKMDIEGHEKTLLRAMKGAWNGHCVLFLETHADNGDDSDTVDELISENFTVELLRAHRLDGDTRVFKEYCCVRTL
jgi:FkbM family methyltransferase